MLPPPLEYPLTRQFGGKRLSTIAYALGLVVVLILCLLNVALVGYESVTDFGSDFNVTQNFWFDAFVPAAVKKQKPGTLCSPQLFNVGESMATNSSIFNWKVGSVVKANAGGSGFSYKGETLENCDIHRVDLLGDLRTWSLDANVYMHCAPPGTDGVPKRREEWELAGVNTLSISALAARQTYGLFADSFEALVIYDLLILSGIDLWSQFYSTFSASNTSGVATISILSEFDFCPISHSRDPSSACAQGFSQPPNVTFSSITAVTNDNRVIPDIISSLDDSGAMYELDPAVRAPALNFLHLVHAAARIDIGNTAPNNFITNLDMIDSVLEADLPVPPGAPPGSIPVRSHLYDRWKSQVDPLDNTTYPAIEVPGPSTLKAVFVCRLLELKSTGSLIISVLVATQSMFMTAWGVGLLVAAFFAKRGLSNASHCAGCVGAEVHKNHQGVSETDGKMEGSSSSTSTVDAMPHVHNDLKV